MPLTTRIVIVSVDQPARWFMDAEWHPLRPGAWLVTGTPYESGGPLQFATPYFLVVSATPIGRALGPVQIFAHIREEEGLHWGHIAGFDAALKIAIDFADPAQVCTGPTILVGEWAGERDDTPRLLVAVSQPLGVDIDAI